jgi:hypothetical protein
MILKMNFNFNYLRIAGAGDAVNAPNHETL